MYFNNDSSFKTLKMMIGKKTHLIPLFDICLSLNAMHVMPLV